MSLTGDCNANVNNMSRLMRKPKICMGENKDADQLRGNREADQRLCFHYTDTVVQFLYFSNPKFQASSHLLCLYRPVCVGPVWKPHCFPTRWLICFFLSSYDRPVLENAVSRGILSHFDGPRHV